MLAKSSAESLELPNGWGSKPCTPGEQPNPTTKIPTKLGGEFTYPEMGFDWF